MSKFIAVVTALTILAAGLSGCGATEPSGRPYDADKIDAAIIARTNDFSFDLLREINETDSNGNLFLSPLSISTALTMTYNGAKGNTMADMERGLRYQGFSKENVNETYQNLIPYLLQVDKEVDLTISNSIWYRMGEAIQEAFIETNKQVFDAEVRELDFSDPASADSINQWIDDATKGKIDRMIEPPIPATVVMYLINAVYFKGDWTTPFDKDSTQEADFTNIAGAVQRTDMMGHYGDVDYGQGDGYKAVRLPYGKEKVSMYLLLPTDGKTINDWVADLNADVFADIRSSITTQEKVDLRIPKFKMEYDIKELNNELISMGMVLPFDPAADFSGIREGLFISQVLHKAVIEVNEEGSEAAGVTVVVMEESAALEPLTFIADQPFLFLIAEEGTGSILFLGKFTSAE
ncbi:MAG: proteinase IV [Firmicutes bacterium HGW-Firmicutes-11]|jgi:serpin B|nr:MAG: proteinase IV [Firmicutes bacterium HGW-Firmicutes-11]